MSIYVIYLLQPNNLLFSCSPTQVVLPNDVRIVRSYCGYDGSMFITERGSLLACGMNSYNKLGLNEQKGFLLQMKQFIAKVCSF